MKKKQSNGKRLLAAVVGVAAMVLAGAPSSSLALDFPIGDLGFIVYGGNTERYENMLSSSNALESSTSNIAADLPLLLEGASLGLRYSIIGTSASGLDMYVSSVNPTLSAAQVSNSLANVAVGSFLFWGGQHAAQTGGVSNPYANNPSLTSRAAGHSFTSILQTDGSLDGNLGFTIHAPLDQMLTIFRINIDGEAPSAEAVATAMLTSNGQLNVAAIPIPAAAVLFGTGLIGLVGIARRSIGNKRAA